MIAAGFCVAVGVNSLGYRVIFTMGTGLTKLDYLKGFCIEMATTIAVLLASELGLPISTTHC